MTTYFLKSHQKDSTIIGIIFYIFVVIVEK